MIRVAAGVDRAPARGPALDALDLVDVTRGKHTKDKHAYLEGILLRWAGGDIAPVMLKARGMDRNP